MSQAEESRLPSTSSLTLCTLGGGASGRLFSSGSSPSAWCSGRFPLQLEKGSASSQTEQCSHLGSTTSYSGDCRQIADLSELLWEAAGVRPALSKPPRGWVRGHFEAAGCGDGLGEMPEGAGEASPPPPRGHRGAQCLRKAAGSWERRLTRA